MFWSAYKILYVNINQHIIYLVNQIWDAHMNYEGPQPVNCQQAYSIRGAPCWMWQVVTFKSYSADVNINLLSINMLSDVLCAYTVSACLFYPVKPCKIQGLVYKNVAFIKKNLGPVHD